MSKETVYYPNYQMRPRNYKKRDNEYSFRLGGACLVAKAPMFRSTATQKAAMGWAQWYTPPVICIRHSAPTEPDKRGFRDPNELHRHYRPYAMCIATLECLDEEKPRQIKVYFCCVSLHEHNQMNNIDVEHNDWYIEPLDEVSRSQARHRLLS